MTKFNYVARDESGNQTTGIVSAASPSEAARQIRAEGKFVVRIVPISTAAGPIHPAKNRNKKSDKFRKDDLIYFTNQMAVMVETGVSLAEALEGCVHDGNSPRFARALGGVIDRVNAGAEFSAALADFPNVFPPLYISLIKASEASGMLAPILKRMAQHLENQRELTKKIKGAVTYPIVMLIFALGVTVFLLTFVLPKFTAIYAGRETNLPWITRALLAFSDVMLDYGLYILFPLVAGVIALVVYMRRPEGRATVERVKLRVPLIGPLYHKTYLARSLRTLGTMIQSGVSVLEGIKLTSAACGSLEYESMWNDVYERLERGQQISEALSDNCCVPKAVNKMLAAGERSGQLGSVMERVAGFCEAELSLSIKALTSLLEPAIVMFLGIVVGGLVIALLLPIFTISKAM